MLYVLYIKDLGSQLTQFRLKLEEYNYAAGALSIIIHTLYIETTTNYHDVQEYLGFHIITNPKTKEKVTNEQINTIIELFPGISDRNVRKWS